MLVSRRVVHARRAACRHARVKILADRRLWFSSQQSLWQFVSLPNLCAPGRVSWKVRDPVRLLIFGDKMKKENQPPQTIGETVRSAFKLAAGAAALRDVLAKQLPRCTGREYAVLRTGGFLQPNGE
jgi:hypothetical protein